MQLGSCVSAQAGSCSSNLTPSLGTSICRGSGPRNGNNNNNNNNNAEGAAQEIATTTTTTKDKKTKKKKENHKMFLTKEHYILHTVLSRCQRYIDYCYFSYRSHPQHWLSTPTFYLFLFLFYYFIFRATPPRAYGGSRARGRIGAVAAGPCHSHSNMGSEPHL